MKIACIDNYDSFVFNLVRYLKTAQENLEVRVFRNTEIDFDYLASCDGILLSPGPGIPSEAGKLMAVIEQFHTTKSMLGVCLGHQALGEFFGANLEQCAQPIHGKSDLIKQLLPSPIFKNIHAQMEVGRYHSWRVRLSGNEPLIVTSQSADHTIMSIQHQTLPIYGVQFHPESILTPNGKQMISNWIKTLTHEKNT